MRAEAWIARYGPMRDGGMIPEVFNKPVRVVTVQGGLVLCGQLQRGRCGPFTSQGTVCMRDSLELW